MWVVCEVVVDGGDIFGVLLVVEMEEEVYVWWCAECEVECAVCARVQVFNFDFGIVVLKMFVKVCVDVCVF